MEEGEAVEEGEEGPQVVDPALASAERKLGAVREETIEVGGAGDQAEGRTTVAKDR